MKNLLRFAICIAIIFQSVTATAQISGTVYLDINNSGTRTVAPATPFEPGVYNVTVRAFNSTGTQVGTTTTDANGAYSLPGVTTFPVRLEFTTAASQFPGKRPNANQSNVQFIAATTATANYAVGYNTMYTNNPNPFVVTNGVVNGNRTGGGTSGTQHTLFVLPYSLTNTVTSFGGANYQNRWIGSVFGMTYQRETRTVLMAAYLKRHSGFGPGGIDAIYKTIVDAAGNATQPAVLFKLSNLGINVGTDPRSVALPAASASPNQDPGVFAEVGKRGIGNIDLAENGKDLYVTNLFQNNIHRINIGMPAKSSFSAADVTGTWNTGPDLAGTEWHIMGVKFYNGKVYVGGVTSIQRSIAPVANAANLAADQVNLRGYVYELDPVTGTVTEVMQFPFNYRRGHCNNDYRYEFKNNYWRAWQNNGDADILRADINAAYLPLSTATGNNTGIYYPQLMISDIEIDVDGSMVLGIRDRFADQSGYNNWLEGPNGTSTVGGGDNRTFRGVNSGEVLRAGKSGANWTIENNAVVTTNTITTNTNNAGIQGTPAASSAIGGSWSGQTGTPWGWGAAAGQGYGPGGRYYYFNHAATATGVPIANIQDGTVGTFTQHTVKPNGGLALMAGYDEVINTAMDPDGIAFTSGLLRFANKGEATGTNAGNMTDQHQLLPWPVGTAPPGAPAPDPTTMGKSNGLGDVEILFDAMKIEIGNRIWNDNNSNGIQDANESGISGVTILLRSPGADGIFGNADDQTWTTTTDANGNYYFDNTAAGGNVNDSRAIALGFTGLPAGNTGILNSQDYRIEINPVQAPISSLIISPADAGGSSFDHIDNDGTQGNLSGVGVRLFANVNTSNTDYNYDFGFMTSTLPVRLLNFTAQPQGSKVSLTWKVTEQLHINSYTAEHSTNGTAFSAIQNVTANTNTDAVYHIIHANPANGINYYRIKIAGADGSVKYSMIRIVIFNSKGALSIFPNPANDKVNIQMPEGWQGKNISFKILNQLGQEIISKQFENASQVETINISNLPSGLYSVRMVKSDGATQSRKLNIYK